MDWNRGEIKREINTWMGERIGGYLWQALVVIIVQSFRNKKSMQSFYMS
jgi:hypothetical protein